MIGAALIPIVKVSHRPSPSQGSTLSIYCSWQGASPRVIEQEITSRIEAAVSAVQGVKSVISVSNNGSGSVSVILKEGINVSATRFEISSLLKQIAPKLPEGAEYPMLDGGSVSTGNETTKQLLVYRINADMRQDQIQEYANKNIKPYIEHIKGVAEVTVTGGMPQYLEIEYNPIELSSYGLTSQNVANSIRNFLGQSTVLGDVEHTNEKGEVTRITLNLETSKIGDDISRIPITEVDGKIIYLGSIATLNFKEKETSSYYRVNGLNTIYLEIRVDSKANIISMSETLRAKMESVTANLIDNYHVQLIDDAAEEIKTEINKLVKRTLLSLVILLAFVWLVSRSLRYLSIIAITLTANVLISVIFYYLFDVELHIFSLAGIAVSFGILIDTSIVMVDHYSYYRDRKAFIAILAALLTTIGSLVIIFFMPDYIREELSDFSAIIIINLTVALFVSLFFVPALIDKYNYRSIEARRGVRCRRRIVKFTNIYHNYIRFTQKRKWIYIVIFVLAFGLPVYMLPNKIPVVKWWEKSKVEEKWYHKLYNNTIGSNLYQSTLKEPIEIGLGGTLRLFNNSKGSFSRSGEQPRMQLQIRGAIPEGGTAVQMNEKVLPIEAILAKYDEVERFETNVYDDGANIVVNFTDEALNSSFPYELESEVISEILSVGGADWSTFGVSQRGFSNSLNLAHKAHQISIGGYNYDKLFDIADKLTTKMKSNRRVSDIEIEMAERNRWGGSSKTLNEMYIDYDMKRVAMYEINLAQSYSALSNILSTQSVGSYKDTENGETTSTDISMVSSKRADFDVWHLFNSYVDIGGGKQVRYSLLGEVGKRKARQSIKKVNQEYSIAVAFNYLGSYELADRFIKETTEELNSSLPVGFKCLNNSEGYHEDTGSQYWLIFLIVIIIFFVCSILFESIVQPLVIITLIPLSFIGTFLTFYFSGVKFGTGGFASLVLLSGLVVNAAIYIINEYNNSAKRYGGYKLGNIKLYLKSFNHKIIAVLLTVISTVLGLIPFLMDGAKEQFWFSFAIGTAGGLLFSLLAIILFMPILMPLKNKLSVALTEN